VKRGKKTKTSRVRSTAKKGKKYYFKSKGFGGKFGQFIPPIAGGFLDTFLSNLNIMGFRLPTGVGSAGVGYIMKDPVTMKIGLYQMGGYGAALVTGGTGGAHIGQV
jgi:hypothetical protein